MAIGLAAVAVALIIQGRDGGEPPNPTDGAGTTPRVVSLVERLIPPGEPYRCVSPFHRDHDDRMTMLLEFPDGTPRNFVSDGPEDTSPAFLFCGGSASKNLPGLASGPLRFESETSESVTSISGVYGRDFDAGGDERRVSLTTEVAGDRVCASQTDGAGHARRFTCNLPDGTSLADVVLRLDVEDDQEFSVFAGIGNLRAELGS